MPNVPVSPDYLAFQAADSLQAVCSYLRGVLAMHATLEGAGLAQSGPLAAIYTFILKDGAAMLGSLVFSWAAAHLFDGELRFWRLFADVINDLGLAAELFAPSLGPQLFVPITCAANVAKALCGVAAGATRAALAQHFSLTGAGVAEVQAKEGAQETAVTLVGLLLGLACARALNTSVFAQWTAFSFLTAVHVAANYYAVRVLALRSLNRTRLAANILDDELASVPPRTPAAAAACDPVLPTQYARAWASAFCGGNAAAMRAACCTARTGWLSAWSAEPCSLRIGVPWAAVVAAAKAGSSESRHCRCGCTADAVSVPLPLGGAVIVAVAGARATHSGDQPVPETARAVATLPLGARAVDAAAVYLGMLSWARAVAVPATAAPPGVAAPAPAPAEAAACAACRADVASSATPAAALAHAVADALARMRSRLARLADAGWATDELLVAEEGYRVDLRDLRDVASSPRPASRQPAARSRMRRSSRKLE